jgi:hypothetical protein
MESLVKQKENKWFLQVTTHDLDVREFTLGEKQNRFWKNYLGKPRTEIEKEIGEHFDLRKVSFRKKLGDYVLVSMGVCFDDEIVVLAPNTFCH